MGCLPYAPLRLLDDGCSSQRSHTGQGGLISFEIFVSESWPRCQAPQWPVSGALNRGTFENLEGKSCVVPFSRVTFHSDFIEWHSEPQAISEGGSSTLALPPSDFLSGLLLAEPTWEPEGSGAAHGSAL